MEATFWPGSRRNVDASCENYPFEFSGVPDTSSDRISRTPPFGSHSEMAASLPAVPCESYPSHSWPNIAQENEKFKSLSGRSSHPFLLGRKGNKPQPCTVNTILHSAIATKAYDVLLFLLRCGWECGMMLTQEVIALCTLVCSFFHAVATRDKMRCPDPCSWRQDDQEIMDLMENQTQTLLEVNKFLREELNTVKEEREAAEHMVTRIEEKCRHAVGQQSENMKTHSVFDLLYGAGASQAAFGAGGIDLDDGQLAAADNSAEVSSMSTQVYGPINRPVSWVKLSPPDS